MKIVYTQPDGSTAIMIPAPQSHLARVMPEVEDMTPGQYIEFIRDRDVPPDATNVRIVDDHEIPTDRTFRNALKNDLTFDIDKCVEITKDRLRAEREPLLAELDVEYMRSLEQGKPTTDIAAEKQRLRDITTLPKNTMTLDELKALTATKD
jgi:hypothetical protein